MTPLSDRALSDLLQDEKSISRSHAYVDEEPVALFIQAAGGKILWISLEAEKMLGITLPEARGRCCGDVLRCTLRCAACPAALARAADLAQTGFPVDIRTAKGGALSCIVDAMPLGANLVAVVLREAVDGDTLEQDAPVTTAA